MDGPAVSDKPIRLRVVKGGNEDEPMLKTKRSERFCAHDHVILYTNSRRVYCADCEDEVDAFSALQRFAERYERYVSSINRVKGDLKHYSETLRQVKREIRNARARLRRSV